MTIEILLSILFRLFVVVFLAILLIVGFFLIIRAYKIKAIGFYFAGIAWFLMAFAQILNQLFDIHVMIYAIFSKMSFIFLVVFTNLTFHKEKNLIITKLILVGSIIFAFIAWFFDSMRGNSQLTYNLSRIFDFTHASISLYWLAISCYFAYGKIKTLEIDHWVRVRYRITYIASSIFSFIYLILIFHPYDLPFGDTSTVLGTITFGFVALISISYSIAFLLAWIMPYGIKRILKKGFQPSKEEKMSENELMKLIKDQMKSGLAIGDN